MYAYIITLSSTRVQPLTFEQFSDWLYSAFSFFKEWVGVGTFLACCLGECVVCLWLVCRLRAQIRRDKVIVAQALAALECGSSPQVWLSALKELVGNMLCIAFAPSRDQIVPLHRGRYA